MERVWLSYTITDQKVLHRNVGWQMQPVGLAAIQRVALGDPTSPTAYWEPWPTIFASMAGVTPVA